MTSYATATNILCCLGAILLGMWHSVGSTQAGQEQRINSVKYFYHLFVSKLAVKCNATNVLGYRKLVQCTFLEHLDQFILLPDQLRSIGLTGEFCLAFPSCVLLSLLVHTGMLRLAITLCLQLHQKV
jgi:hypothetical protein